ncbi:MAG: RICIN domain-containing protein [Acidobacteriota bacterium]|nr:MAG: RICIN domain-containing protein [Acidobacteriota bacterium]
MWLRQTITIGSCEKAASTVDRDYSVDRYLGPNSKEGDRAAIFFKLMKRTISDPADRGLLTLALPDLTPEVRIRNEWYKDRFINNTPTGNGTELKPSVTAIQPNWASARWKIGPAEDGWVRIRSAWYPDRYLNVKPTGNGTELVPVLSTIEPNWASAKWKLEPAPGGLVRIRNSWYPDRYLYYDAPNNRLAFGPIQPNWASALWKIE